MVSNSQLLVDETAPRKLAEAHHKGWLAGVALRLGCGSLARNPYDRELAECEWIYWEQGFSEGLAG